MVELLVLEMVEKQYITDQLVLDIIYDTQNLQSESYSRLYNGEIEKDRYGRNMPKPAHGTFRLEYKTSSTRQIMDGFIKLYDNIVNNNLLIRKINICVGNLSNITDENTTKQYEQITLFTDYKEQKYQEEKLQKEQKIQKTIIDIKNKYGKNAIIKGMNLEEGATTCKRNIQIGGHAK